MSSTQQSCCDGAGSAVAKASGRSLVAGFVILKIAGTLIGHVVAVWVLTLKSVLQLPNEVCCG